jgi:transposase-like protein
MSRRRYTDEDKARLLGEFDACGGSAAAFCRDRGLAYQTFISWRRGTPARRDAGTAMEFVELALGPAAGERTTSGPRVELDFGGGMVLRIHLPASRP